MSHFRVIFRPQLDEEEEKILKETLGGNLIFSEYKTKGITGGAFDVQIIIDTLNDPAFTALLHGTEFATLLVALVSKLFKRNTKKIMDNNSRPRYTIVSIRRQTDSIVISNVNQDNKVLILKSTSNFDEIRKQAEKGEDEYSEEKLKEYLKNE